MKSQKYPIDDIMVCDATAAALRECMAKSQNMLVTLSDEYKMTLASLKVGSQVSSQNQIASKNYTPFTANS